MFSRSESHVCLKNTAAHGRSPPYAWRICVYTILVVAQQNTAGDLNRISCALNRKWIRAGQTRWWAS